MFTAIVQNANGNVTKFNESMNGYNKRSKVCDADSQGNVNVNCKR
jgi:hypothetical protein